MALQNTGYDEENPYGPPNAPAAAAAPTTAAFDPYAAAQAGYSRWTGATFDEDARQQAQYRASLGQSAADVEAHAYEDAQSRFPKQGTPVADQWAGHNPTSGAPGQEWYAPWFETFRNDISTRNAETKAKGDQLFATLLGKINQSKEASADDPIIANQVGAYRAEQTRASREYLNALAEQQGPFANLRGDQRMAGEKVGQNVSGFQAKIMADEVNARRAEIMQSLQGALGFVSAQQAQTLQAELEILNQFAEERGLDLQEASIANSRDLGLRNLALNEWDLGNLWDYRFSGLGG